jgi:biopolymer transport protein ExbD
MNIKILRRLEMIDTDGRKKRIKGKKNGPDAAINITPLVDVVLVLLIIFMVVTPLLSEGLELPRAIDPQKLNAMGEDLKISVKRTGQIYFGEEQVEEKNLKTKLEEELNKNPFRPVYLLADKSLQFSSIRTILTALRDAGVAEVGFVSAISDEEP